MSDLCAAVEAALAEPDESPYWDHGDLNDAYLRGLAHARVAMRALIPKGSVLVTEETFAAMLRDVDDALRAVIPEGAVLVQPQGGGVCHYCLEPDVDSIRKALIPEGAVLVTEAALLQVLVDIDRERATGAYPHLGRAPDIRNLAAAILRHLREGT